MRKHIYTTVAIQNYHKIILLQCSIVLQHKVKIGSVWIQFFILGINCSFCYLYIASIEFEWLKSWSTCILNLV